MGRYFSFLKRDLWRMRIAEQPPRRAVLLRLLRILVLAARELQTDKCMLRASALTYYTLLSIVPIFAKAFGVAKGFGMQAILEERIRDAFGTEARAPAPVPGPDDQPLAPVEFDATGQAEVAERVIEFSNRMLESVDGGLVAGIGIAVLFWTIIKGMGNIELSFNEIWGIRQGRTLFRKATDYLSFMMIAPVLIILSGSITVFIQAQVEYIVHKLTILGPVGELLFVLLKVTPLVLLVFLFSFAYAFLPNGKVPWKSALFGGTVGAVLALLVQIVYSEFQIGASNASAVYGSFAALPLFLVWLQTSWLIVLFGAELAFAHQHVDTYEFEEDSRTASLEFQRLACLALAHACVKDLVDENDPPTAENLAARLGLPMRFVNLMLERLEQARVLAPIQHEDAQGPRRWQPAMDVEAMSVASVLRKLERSGTDSLPLHDSPAIERLRASLGGFSEQLAKSPQNITFRELQDA